jgi:hypothetical protein
MDDKNLDKWIGNAFEEEIKIPERLSDRLENKMESYIEAQKLKTKRQNYFKYMGIAASVTLCVGLFFTKFFYVSDKPAKDTFKDPVEAEIYVKQTLALVSANLNKGLSALDKTRKNIDNTNKILNNTLTIK